MLPWNELAFFATRVGTAIVGVVPVVGDQLLLLARGGEDVTGDTLARFYSLHVVILPLVTFALLGVHLFLVQKHGMSVPGREAAIDGDERRMPSMPFVPHFLLRDMVGWYLALALLAALAALFPWELGKKADPFGSAPEGIKPEWYFLFMFQTLKSSRPRSGRSRGGAGRVVLRGLRSGRPVRAVFGLRAAQPPGVEFAARYCDGVFHCDDGLGLVLAAGPSCLAGHVGRSAGRDCSAAAVSFH